MKDRSSSKEGSYLVLRMQPRTVCSEARLPSNELLAANEPTAGHVHTKLSPCKDLHYTHSGSARAHSAQPWAVNQVDAIPLGMQIRKVRQNRRTLFKSMVS